MYGVYNSYGQLERGGFRSYKEADCFRISRQRYDWKIKRIA